MSNETGGFHPREGKNLRAREVGRERIEDGVWIPGSLAEFSDRVAIGSTTKQLEQFADDEAPEKPTPRLRITADAKRVIDDRAALEEALKTGGNPSSVDEYRGKKVVAGLILGRLVKRLDPEADLHNMIKTRLVHGKEIVVVDEAYLAQPKEKLASIVADGIITQMEHVPIMVAAADCAPVFVYDPVTKSMGIFHSGYEGSIARVSSRGIQRMVETFGSRIEDLRVVVGPHIDGAHYPVQTPLYDRIKALTDEQGQPFYSPGDMEEMFATYPEHRGQISFDNGAAIKIEMKKLGIPEAHIEVSSLSTVVNNDFLPSNRLEGDKNRDSFMVAAVLK